MKRFIFSKVAGLEAAALLKTDSLHGCFASILLTFKEKLFYDNLGYSGVFCESFRNESKHDCLAARYEQNI